MAQGGDGVSKPQIWHDSLQNPEILIVANCGAVSVFSHNRVRVEGGGHRKDSARKNVAFSLNAFDLLDYARLLAENGYQQQRVGLETQVWRK